MGLFTLIAVAVICYAIYSIVRLIVKGSVAKAQARAGIVSKVDLD